MKLQLKVKRIDTDFYIDRMFGLPIVVPVRAGIIQDFNDQEYHGHLSGKVIGKHIDELKTLCREKLHKSWVKNFSIGQTYDRTKYSNLEFNIANLKREIANFDKTIIIRRNDYYNKESITSYVGRQQQHEISKTQAVNLLAELEEKFKQAQEEIVAVKLKVFNEHNTKF